MKTKIHEDFFIDSSMPLGMRCWRGFAVFFAQLKPVPQGRHYDMLLSFIFASVGYATLTYGKIKFKPSC
jgi:hypothetical protein